MKVKFTLPTVSLKQIKSELIREIIVEKMGVG